MKKILSSKMGQVLVSTVVVLACLAGLTYWASNMILKNDSILEYIAKKRSQAAADANATTTAVVPNDLEHVAETPEKKEQEEYKEDQEEMIVSAFALLNSNTAPGDLQFTNPKLPVLMSELNSRWNYINERQSELDELEAHVADQLQSMQWHTNQITRNRVDLNKHFEGRINLIHNQEQTRLREMAQIYENLLSPDQPDGAAVIRQILRANLDQDPKLNAKVFQYISVSSQAIIIRTLLSGDDADPELYKNIIENHRKTMTEDSIKPIQ